VTDELHRARSRQAVLFLLISASMIAITARLAYWQIEQHNPLALRADQEHKHPFIVPAGRGSIYDTNGKLLTLTLTVDAVEADPQAIQQENSSHPGTLNQTLDQISTILAIPTDVLRPQIQLAQDGHLLTFTYLHDANGNKIHTTRQQSDQITQLLNQGQLWGIGLLPESQRVYIDGDLAAQLLGFVQQDSGDGQYGVEKYYNTLLAGQPGKLFAETDVDGNPLAIGEHIWQPPVNGAALTLTIDANVQMTVEQMLHDAIMRYQADSGSVIIVNPKTGAVLAMASEPRFDPNQYNHVSSYDLFLNPVTSDVYDPGSTMKAITMAAGLDLQLITPDTTLTDPGYYTVDGIPLFNFNNTGYGLETMTQVLQHSANVGAIWVALQKLHQANFYHYLAQFGFGVPTGVDLPTESPGIVPPPAQRTDLTLAENSYGESIAVTPLQMVMAYAALANGGLLMRPYTVASATQNGHVTTFSPQRVRQAVSPATAQTITQMLVQSAKDGEAQLALVPGYQIAAKTGTSTPNPDATTYTYASVAGFAPASNPQFVMLVKIDHPRAPIFGGLVAAPLWHDIAAWLLHYLRIPPDQPVGNR
jgi:cell division protein FtsI/penicillin-binding protein 2